eukprot:scaffold3393_cov101-Isochrysis_galbana.AAC.4
MGARVLRGSCRSCARVLRAGATDSREVCWAAGALFAVLPRVASCWLAAVSCHASRSRSSQCDDT